MSNSIILGIPVWLGLFQAIRWPGATVGGRQQTENQCSA